MSKPRFRRKVPPSEFSLDKYKALKGKDALFWYLIAVRRNRLNKLLDHFLPRPFESQEVKERILDLLEQQVMDLLRNPMPTQRDIDCFKPSIKERRRAENEFSGIRYLKMRDVLLIADNKDRFGAEIDAYQRSKESRLKPAEDCLLDEPVHFAGILPKFPSGPMQVYVEIELSAPNAILTREFARWLNATRKSISEKQGVPREKHRCGPLDSALFDNPDALAAVPYVDLKLWSKMFGVHISTIDYARASCDPFTGEISIKTENVASEIVTDKFCDMTLGQAYAECLIGSADRKGKKGGFKSEAQRVDDDD
jgi:hypothetical protein